MSGLVSLLDGKGRVWNPPEGIVLFGPAPICAVTCLQHAPGAAVDILRARSPVRITCLSSLLWG